VIGIDPNKASNQLVVVDAQDACGLSRGSATIALVNGR
jgi:hypothetical protein